MPPYKNKPLKVRLKEHLDRPIEAETKSDAIIFNAFFVFTMFYTAFFLGYRLESQKTAHLTALHHPNSVAAIIYNDKVLLKPYDPETLKLSKDLAILSLDSDKELTLKSKELGTLISTNPYPAEE
jgi:hypothetical protein